MQGFNVLHPMGWDSFGLPAEQYALQTGTHPRITTEKNINRRVRQRVRVQRGHAHVSMQWSTSARETDASC